MTALHPGTYPLAELPGRRPFLQVVVDTEEEFDWSKPFRRDRVSVGSMQAQWRTQEIFDAYQLRPTYVIDHPVATDPDAVEILKSFVSAGRCQIGTHLHPWVNPPFAEAVLRSNSYAGNLPGSLERAKLETLHRAITAAFSESPVIYKAGRYGLGPNTIEILSSLGYLVDVSVVPHTDFGSDGGPDFRGMPDRPFWLNGVGGILEIPLTRGFCGMTTGHRAAALYDSVKSSRAGNLKLSALSRLGILSRVSLTPEGIDKASMLRLLKSMVNDGHRLFTLCYHSPSLAIGNTPYVHNAKDLTLFLESIRAVLDFFFGTLGGAPTTPLAVRDMALQAGAPAGVLVGA
ncbi:polysaccharide deacetylase family protein [Humitalea sp. 24SJ18S-53]|uniref:polysaccharide deacetylase family protein n=1 Tax=Humitalea sp. 24SJ18S-53 TaxID=3422307 RepID=UPI003D6695D0